MVFTGILLSLPKDCTIGSSSVKRAAVCIVLIRNNKRASFLTLYFMVQILFEILKFSRERKKTRSATLLVVITAPNQTQAVMMFPYSKK